MSIIIEAGIHVIFQCLQALAGCVIAYLLYGALREKNRIIEEFTHEKLLLVFFMSLLGLALPLSIFGMIPLGLALHRLGFRVWAILPLCVSGLIFNPLVFFYDLSFSLRTVLYRTVLGLVAGIVSGLLLILFNAQEHHILRISKAERLFTGDTKCTFKGLLTFVNRYVDLFGAFLLLGSIAQVLFQKFAYYDLVNMLDIGSLAAGFFGFIKGYDITTPVFLLNMSLLDILMNLATLTGLFSILKTKGVFFWLVYHGFLIFLISLVNLLFLIH